LRQNCAENALKLQNLRILRKIALRNVANLPKFAQKLRAEAKFAKNCDLRQKGEICAKIAPRKIVIFFKD